MWGWLMTGVEKMPEARLSTPFGARVGVSGELAVAGAYCPTERGFSFSRGWSLCGGVGGGEHTRERERRGLYSGMDGLERA